MDQKQQTSPRQISTLLGSTCRFPWCYRPEFVAKCALAIPLWKPHNSAMNDLTRISISLETALLEAFDRSNAGKGYATRSEAVRDLIRDRLIREEAAGPSGGDAEQVAVVTLVMFCET